jgi:putative sporulation protein YyaC
MKTTPNDDTLKVSYTSPTASLQLAGRLSSLLDDLDPDRRIAVVCLGTDRSTGDSLGPLAGSALSKYHSQSFELFGTLEEPVHAKNLDKTLEHIYSTMRDPFIIGVDACLGRAASVGCIEVGAGPVCPGSGLRKELPAVGDIHIAGVVNVGGLMEYLVLQSTRLHVVMGMAELIARSVFRAVVISSGGHRKPAKKLMYT